MILTFKKLAAGAAGLVVCGTALAACTSWPERDLLPSPPATTSAPPVTLVPVPTGTVKDDGAREGAQGKATQSETPGVFEYVPVEGDYLGAIARRFETCTADLFEANGRYDIYAGSPIQVARTTTTPLTDSTCTS